MYLPMKSETQHLLVVKIMNSGASILSSDPSSVSYYFYALGLNLPISLWLLFFI